MNKTKGPWFTFAFFGLQGFTFGSLGKYKGIGFEYGVVVEYSWSLCALADWLTHVFTWYW